MCSTIVISLINLKYAVLFRIALESKTLIKIQKFHKSRHVYCVVHSTYTYVNMYTGYFNNMMCDVFVNSFIT